MSLLDLKQIKNAPSKLPVRAVTTAAMAAGGTPVYVNGTLGFGATLTAGANSAIDVVDGVTLAAGDRILLKNEAAPETNGIYVVTALGSGAAKWIITRASDADTNVKTFAGITVTSTGDGTANKNRNWSLQTTGALTIGTTAQTWALAIDSSAVVSTKSNKNMTASATTADFQAATATTMAATPANGCYIQVFVNGMKQTLGDAVRTTDCYFSSDGGTTPRAITAIASGDTLYWVGSVASYQLATTDKIDFDYLT